MRPTARGSFAFAFCVAVAAWAGPLRAAPGPRVGVVPFAGSGEGPLRAAVVKALKANRCVVVGGKQIQSAAASLRVTLDEDGGFAAVAKELGIAAFVVGEVGPLRATITIRNGADGSVAAEALFAGAKPKKLKAAISAGFWRRLGSAIGRSHPPAGAKAKSEVAEESPPPDEEAMGAGPPGKESAAADEGADKPPARAVSKPDQEAAEPSESAVAEAPPPKRRRPPATADPTPAVEHDETSPPIALELGVGGKAMFRRLSWHQDVQDPQGKIAPYALSPGPEVGAWVELYPAAFATDGLAADLGIFGAFDYGLGVKSKLPDGSLLTTKFQDFLVGLKLRLPLGVFNPFFSAAYGQQTFRLESASGMQAIPAVDYKLLRFGAGARLVFARALFMDLDGAYLWVRDLGTQPGEIGGTDYFPLGKAYGVDVDASLGIRLGSVLALRVGVDFRQYGLDFHVPPSAVSTNAPIVGGAVDRYVAVWGGLEIAIDGAGRAEPPAAPASAPSKLKRRPKVPAPSRDDD